MTDPQRLHDDDIERAYRTMLRNRGNDRRDCVEPEALLGIVEGKLPELERLAVLRHVGSCEPCRRELEMLRLTADVAAQAERPAWQQRASWLAAAAALVVIAGGVALWNRSAGGPGVDIPRSGVATALALVAPADSAVAPLPLAFAWARVPGARNYALEVVDTQGAPAFSVTTSDTTVTLDRSRLRANEDYRWWVVAGMADGAELRSAVRRLRITP
jgi:hypothetical protein